MARHTARDWTIEEFENWMHAADRFAAVAKAADEEGGPSLSLVPKNKHEFPRAPDALPSAAADPSGTGEPGTDRSTEAGPFDHAPLEDSRKSRAGWSAWRQRAFLANLAETGSVHLACADAGLSARSAYGLRARSPAFAAAWDVADQLAVGRLSAIAFDRAINGRTEQVWHGGELVAEKRLPSDKLLMWLLARLDPRRFAAPWELRGDRDADPQTAARESFPALLDAIEDVERD